MVYTAEYDPLCYEGTTVLRNKMDLRDQEELDEFELTMFLTRSEELWPEGSLDFPHYLALQCPLRAGGQPHSGSRFSC
ncbi:hypothetical protein [Pararhizobium sp. A13]|uniref:hypothetical protein n=1 Tax=Pararhizobium sp. A13 TaxID=3133975 RepID=UPI0032457376